MNLHEYYRRLSGLEEKLGFRFRDPSLLLAALTHRSFSAEHKNWSLPDNERLEFLGDAVLSAVISHLLYEKYPSRPEGELSKMRAWLVREERLARVAERLGLQDYLLLSRGEVRSGGPKKTSILAGTLEAIIGAVYLDGGYGKVFELVRRLFNRLLSQAEKGLLSDYRSRLQEITQAQWGEAPVYRLVKESGPSHAPSFEIEVLLQGEVLARGKGRSKKEAAQEAARRALQKLREEHKI